MFNFLLGSKETGKKAAVVGMGLAIVSLPFSMVSTRSAEKIEEKPLILDYL